MPRLVHRNPKYRRHRASGQAVVTIDGRDVYLGPHGTKASHQEYDRVIAEWLSNGRQSPHFLAAEGEAGPTVTELLAAFWRHAQTYYVGADGQPTSELGLFRDALIPVRRLYGTSPTANFGPVALKTVRQQMVDKGWCRKSVNRGVGRVRRVFKWGVEHELVPPSVWHSLEAVAPLKSGRSGAPDNAPVKPADPVVVAAVLPLVSRQVRAMIELQLLTGMRSGEVTSMRWADIDTTGDVWIYRPPHHKTAHHGHSRVVHLGPRAQLVLDPFRSRSCEAFIFSPAEAEAERRARRTRARKTPMSCGNGVGTNRARKPKRAPGARYLVSSYAKAVAAACRRAFPPPEHLRERERTAEQRSVLAAWREAHHFHPHQLRHTLATTLRREYGVEAAQVVLGHKSLTVTQVYAEKNLGVGSQIAALVG